jgi:hypothetical protein
MFLNFFLKLKTDLDIINSVTCKHAKFYTKFFIMWVHRNDKICRFENIHTQIYMFLYSLKYKVFEHDFLVNL